MRPGWGGDLEVLTLLNTGHANLNGGDVIRWNSLASPFDSSPLPPGPYSPDPPSVSVSSFDMFLLDITPYGNGAAYVVPATLSVSYPPCHHHWCLTWMLFILLVLPRFHLSHICWAAFTEVVLSPPFQSAARMVVNH